MLTDFNRSLELMNGYETDYLKMLYYELSPASCDFRSYENIRFCTILEGRKRVSINKDVSFTYRPGQYILLPSHSSVHMDIEVPTRALVLELYDSLLKRVMEKICVDIDADGDSPQEDRFFFGDLDNELGKCLNRLADVAAMPDKNKKFLLDLYAQELVYYLVQTKGTQQVIDFEHDHPIHRSIRYIRSNIRQPISLSRLACDLNMSETNFCNTFKKIMGITPKEYITNLKLPQAKEMLKKQNVTEVAYDLGYENISHFIALFKNRYGITPKQYKSIGNVPVVYKF